MIFYKFFFPWPKVKSKADVAKIIKEYKNDEKKKLLNISAGLSTIPYIHNNIQIFATKGS